MSYAFAYCTGLTSTSIPTDMSSIPNGLYCGCSGLTTIDIPNSVTFIGEYAFYGCTGICNVSIPERVRTIQQCAFGECSSIKELTLPSSLRSMGMSAFAGCTQIEHIELPPNLSRLSSTVFTGCAIKEIIIPDNLSVIDDYALRGCSQLTNVTIGKSVKSIGESAFENCPLSIVTSYAETPPVCKASSFTRTDIILNGTILEVPKGTVSNYKNATAWNYFKSINELPDPCAIPTIEFTNGELVFSSATEGAEFHYNIKSNDVKSGISNNGHLSMNAEYIVSVYATAEGYRPSETVTRTIGASALDGTKGDMNNDGMLSISDITKLVDLVKTAK